MQTAAPGPESRLNLAKLDDPTSWIGLSVEQQMALNGAASDPSLADGSRAISTGFSEHVMLPFIDDHTGTRQLPDSQFLEGLLNPEISDRVDVVMDGAKKTLHTFAGPELLNETALSLGMVPGVDTVEFVVCEEGGRVNPVHWLGHVGAKEAMQARHQDRQAVNHDRRLDGHPLTWWTMPKSILDDLAAESVSRIESHGKANDKGPTSEAYKSVEDLASATDSITELNTSGDLYYILKGLPIPGKNTVRRLMNKRSNPHIAYNFVNELYFGGEGPDAYHHDGQRGLQSRIKLKAALLHRDVFRKAKKLSELAEQMRPDFS